MLVPNYRKVPFCDNHATVLCKQGMNLQGPLALWGERQYCIVGPTCFPFKKQTDLPIISYFKNDMINSTAALQSIRLTLGGGKNSVCGAHSNNLQPLLQCSTLSKHTFFIFLKKKTVQDYYYNNVSSEFTNHQVVMLSWKSEKLRSNKSQGERCCRRQEHQQEGTP